MKSRALGAVLAQVLQAAGSFGIQIVAAWTLGASGLAMVSLCLGVIVLATAIASGMVGDSLVILERDEPAIRGALQLLALVIGLGSAVVSGAVLSWTMLSPLEAVLFAVALLVFQLEEILRRVFMATMLFWRLIAVDATAVTVTLAVVGLWTLVHGATLTTFFVALIVGQCAGVALAVALLPASERRWVNMRDADIKHVVSFGAWRGAQVSITPLLMTVVRTLVVAFAGSAALGQVEGARIFAAPVILVVQGLGSYLLSSYVRDKAKGVDPLLSRARKASWAMIGGAVVIGSALVALAPVLGVIVSGGTFTIERVTVAAWMVYVIGLALFQPFASLASVLGRQQYVFACRLTDAVFTTSMLTLMLAIGVVAAFAPFALAAGLVVGSVLMRVFVLGRLRTPDSNPS